MTGPATLAIVLTTWLIFSLGNATQATNLHAHEDDLWVVDNHHAAHQHGLAHANLSLEDSTLQMTLIIAADDVLSGQSQIESTIHTFEDLDRLFRLPDHCTVTSAPSSESLRQTITRWTPGHNDLALNYQWQCAKPVAFKIEFVLFDVFPSIESINVQFISAQVQRKTQLNSKNRRLSLAP